MSETPSKRRRKGREAFEPGVDPNDFNPYLHEQKDEWFSAVHAQDWWAGWIEAQEIADVKDESQEYWVTATFNDLSEEQIGEVTFDSSNPPIELEIDGVTYKPEP